MQFLEDMKKSHFAVSIDPVLIIHSCGDLMSECCLVPFDSHIKLHIHSISNLSNNTQGHIITNMLPGFKDTQSYIHLFLCTKSAKLIRLLSNLCPRFLKGKKRGKKSISQIAIVSFPNQTKME